MYKDGMNVFGGKKMVHIKIGVLPLKRNRIFFFGVLPYQSATE